MVCFCISCDSMSQTKTDSKQHQPKVVSLVRKVNQEITSPGFVMPFDEHDILSENDKDYKAATAANNNTHVTPIQDIKDWKALEKSDNEIEWEKLIALVNEKRQSPIPNGSRLWIARPVKTKELVKDPMTGKITAVAVDENENGEVYWMPCDAPKNMLQSPRPVIN